MGSGERPSYPAHLYVPLSFLSTNNWVIEPGHLSSDFGALTPLISLFAWIAVNAGIFFLLLSLPSERR